MNFNPNQIKFGALMKNEEAAAILKNAFPEWVDSPVVKLAENMSVSKVLKIASKHVPKEKLEEVIEKLSGL